MTYTANDIRAMTGVDLSRGELDALLDGPSRLLPLIGELVTEANLSRGPWVVTISGWHPPKLNELMSGHWAKAARLKKACTAKIRRAMNDAGVPVATGKRRIAIEVYVSGPGRRPDPDSFLKATLDALKHAGTIIDDDARRCEWSMPVVVPGPKRTVITIEDIDHDRT